MGIFSTTVEKSLFSTPVVTEVEVVLLFHVYRDRNEIEHN